MTAVRETVRPEFPAVVHTYTDALRVLRAAPDGALPPGELAERTDRVPSNLRRDIQRLRDAGVVAFVEGDDRAHLTAKGRLWLAGQDVAEGAGAPAADGVLRLRHGQLSRDPEQPRKTFSLEALSELRHDLVTHGQLQNLLVRPDPDEDGAYLIVGGERRWRAIGDAIADGDWPEDRLLLCVLRPDEGETERLLVQLSENLQRQALSPLEEARAFQALVESGVGTDEVADRVHVSRRQVQMRLQLLELPATDQARLELPAEDPKHLSVTEARRILQRPKEPEPDPIPAEDLLVLAEVQDRLLAQPAGYRQTECSPHVGGEQFERLLGNGYSGAFSVTRNHWKDGRTYIGLGWSVGRALDGAGLSEHSPERAEKLQALRSELLGAEVAERIAAGARYATEWLNGPWDVTPEGQAVLDARAAAEAEREAQMEARRLESVEADRRGEEALEQAQQVRTRLAEQPPELRPHLADELPPAFLLAEAPLPWTVFPNGCVVDSEGAPVISANPNARPGAVARMTLMVLAVNTAAGLATPEPPLPEEEDPDQTIDGGDPDAVEFDDLEDADAD